MFACFPSLCLSAYLQLRKMMKEQLIYLLLFQTQQIHAQQCDKLCTSDRSARRYESISNALKVSVEVRNQKYFQSKLWSQNEKSG